jgi:alpha,alpha-trehalose phosphorylase
MYALKKYFNVTGDQEFLFNMGAEMLFDTARFWMSHGDYIEGKGFCLNLVTGPDEYTALVNNNTYTNMMAQEHLRFAVYVRDIMLEHAPDKLSRLKDKLSLKDTEFNDWLAAADQMYFRRDLKRGIYGQDDSFLEKATWDFDNTPAEKYPLLLHYHYLNIYRKQVLKQADVVMAIYLLPNLFSRAEKKRNFDFYEPLTTHDSSLSASIHAIVASELGYQDRAYEFFCESSRLDLDDYHSNVKDGLHFANMAGNWLALVNGFAGMREINQVLHFSRMFCPPRWEGFKFRLQFRGRILEIAVNSEEMSYQLLSGPSLEIIHRNAPLHLESGKIIKKSLRRELAAVIFDLDGVITDTAEHHYLAWKEAAEQLGVPFDRKFNEQLKGVGRMESLEIILNQTGREFPSYEKERLASQKNERYRELISKMSPTDLAPGVDELLKKLRNAGILVALASSSKNAETVLERLEIRELFDLVVNPEDVRIGKPDPEIFFMAAKGLKVPYRNCVGVEDAKAGVKAIREAQMIAIGVGSPEELTEAHAVVSDAGKITIDFLRDCIARNR